MLRNCILHRDVYVMLYLMIRRDVVAWDINIAVQNMCMSVSRQLHYLEIHGMHGQTTVK